MTESFMFAQLLSFLGDESAKHEALAFEILVSAAGGDSTALARLYDATAEELYGLALWRCGNRAVAEDAVQEVFCRLASGAVRLPAKLASPRAWLLASVRNAVIDLQRRAARWTVLEDAALELVRARADEHREETLALSLAIAELSSKLREALYLHAYAGMTFREAGAVLGVPTFTAASRYRLALRRLEKRLGGGQ